MEQYTMPPGPLAVTFSRRITHVVSPVFSTSGTSDTTTSNGSHCGSEAAVNAADSIFHIVTRDRDRPAAEVRSEVGAAHDAVAEAVPLGHVGEIDDGDAAAAGAEEGEVGRAQAQAVAEHGGDERRVSNHGHCLAAAPVAMLLQLRPRVRAALPERPQLLRRPRHIHSHLHAIPVNQPHLHMWLQMRAI